MSDQKTTVLKPLVPLEPPAAPLSQAEREAAEAERARSTSLSLVFEVMCCGLASTTPVEGSEIPRTEFTTVPCIRGYDQPNQECRSCVHGMPRRVGTLRGLSANRYHGHGAVFPITEEQADRITDLLEAEGSTPLKNIDWEQHFAAQQQAQQAQHDAEAHARALETQQAGPHGRRPIS